MWKLAVIQSELEKIVNRHEKINPRIVAWLHHFGCPFFMYRDQAPRLHGHESGQPPVSAAR
jgi:hypothetical protein